MDFSPLVLEHFRHPRRTGVIAAAELAPGERLLTGDAGQLSRGEALRLTLRVQAAGERILDARFQNFGAPQSLASASYFCEQLPGKTLDEAARISALDLDAALGGLPELKRRQPVLVLEAFDRAFRAHRGLPARDNAPAPGEPVLCACFQVPEAVIEKAVRLRGLKTVDEITAATRAGGGCSTCHPELEDLLARCARKEYRHHLSAADVADAVRLYGIGAPLPGELQFNPPPPRGPRTAPGGFVYPDRSPVAELVRTGAAPAGRPSAADWHRMSHAERLARIAETIERDLRPAVQSDGGDIELAGLEGNRVQVRLHGHCRNCHSATHTLKLGVEKRLQEAVWPELEVQELF